MEGNLLMTCVVALSVGGLIFMGADSAGVAGLSIQTRIDPKIYKVGPFLFGFTTSFRMGQLLGHSFKVPDRDPRHSVEKFMATAFIDAVRECLKTGGWAKKQSESEEGGTFLVGYEGRIFTVYDDYQVGEIIQPYAAVGCGADIALGSLYTSLGTNLSPPEMIDRALHAAEAFSAGVRGPFLQMSTE